MEVGKDFPSLFKEQNLSFDRAGIALYNPESLISGKELSEGLNYKNSYRNWASIEDYELAVTGRMSTEDILEKAPRVLRSENAG